MIPDLCVGIIARDDLSNFSPGPKSLPRGIEAPQMGRRASLLRIESHSTRYRGLPEDTVAKLEALAAGDTGFSHISRQLVIRSLLPNIHVDDMDISLKGVRTVHWTVLETDTDWVQEAVVDFLAIFDPLEELYMTDWLLSSVERWMRQVIENSPNLEVLSVPVSRRQESEIWATLGQHHIQLKELYACTVSEPMLKLLASYSGLLIRNTLESRLGTFFFGTLSRSTCLPYYEDDWSFGRHNIELISQLRQMDTLEGTVNADEMGPGSPKNIVLSALTSPRRSMLPTPVQKSLLEMAAEMPALRYFAIFSASPRHSGCRSTFPATYSGLRSKLKRPLTLRRRIPRLKRS
ncbi:hypothetical protein DFH09DRAFT_1281659 [Mycena vulgaris]|nr:hypothetical protein DFH09DRAFT_1281659 [Mycena vulgaris]